MSEGIDGLKPHFELHRPLIEDSEKADAVRVLCGIWELSDKQARTLLLFAFHAQIQIDSPFLEGVTYKQAEQTVRELGGSLKLRQTQS